MFMFLLKVLYDFLFFFNSISAVGVDHGTGCRFGLDGDYGIKAPAASRIVEVINLQHSSTSSGRSE